MGYSNRTPITALKASHLKNSVQDGKITPGSSATAMIGYGILTGSSLATDAGGSTSSDNFGVFFKQDSSALSGNNVGNLSADARASLNIGFDVAIAFRLSRATNIRACIGLGAGSSLGQYLDSDTLAAAFIGIQFSTPRGDTTFRFITSTGAAQTTVDSGVTVAAGANDVYVLRLETLSSSLVRLTIYDENGTQLATTTMSATLPGASSLLRLAVMHEPQNTTPTSQYSYFMSLVNKGIKLP